MSEGPSSSRTPPTGEPAIYTLISAALFLYFGFFVQLLTYESDPLVQRASVAAFVWMARIVGVGLLLIAGLDYLRVPFSAPLNLAVSALAAAGCIVCGAIWLVNGYAPNGVLLLLFGLLNAASVRGAWRALRRQA